MGVKTLATAGLVTVLAVLAAEDRSQKHGLFSGATPTGFTVEQDVSSDGLCRNPPQRIFSMPNAADGKTLDYDVERDRLYPVDIDPSHPGPVIKFKHPIDYGCIRA